MNAKNPIAVTHIIYKFAVGGLENGLVNLINRLPDHYCHRIISLTDVDEEFAGRLTRQADLHCLNKGPGSTWKIFPALSRLLRQQQPDIVHTRNLATIECLPMAALTGIPQRVHGEHGRDYEDRDGLNGKNLLTRKLTLPFAHRIISLSRAQQDYLVDYVGVKPEKISQIYNGVDTAKFTPRPDRQTDAADKRPLTLGTVGRMDLVKDQPALCRAFIALVEQFPEQDLRLILVGDGEKYAHCQQLLTDAGVLDRVTLPGSRPDVDHWLRKMDIFVLPSLAEGISNTILEAMASGLPVVATDVGGNAELVADTETGFIVPPSNPAALAAALGHYLNNPGLRLAHGRAALDRVNQLFALERMVESYDSLYQSLLVKRRAA